jgi:hypothetical protein
VVLVRYEDVEGCLGDDPRDRSLFVREADPVVDRPTLAEAQQDEAELRSWPRAQYSDGGI